jgi:hypothetical protein
MSAVTTTANPANSSSGGVTYTSDSTADFAVQVTEGTLSHLIKCTAIP